MNDFFVKDIPSETRIFADHTDGPFVVIQDDISDQATQNGVMGMARIASAHGKALRSIKTDKIDEEHTIAMAALHGARNAAVESGADKAKINAAHADIAGYMQETHHRAVTRTPRKTLKQVLTPHIQASE